MISAISYSFFCVPFNDDGQLWNYDSNKYECHFLFSLSAGVSSIIASIKMKAILFPWITEFRSLPSPLCLAPILMPCPALHKLLLVR